MGFIGLQTLEILSEHCVLKRPFHFLHLDLWICTLSAFDSVLDCTVTMAGCISPEIHQSLCSNSISTILVVLQFHHLLNVFKFKHKLNTISNVNSLFLHSKHYIALLKIQLFLLFGKIERNAGPGTVAEQLKSSTCLCQDPIYGCWF